MRNARKWIVLLSVALAALALVAYTLYEQPFQGGSSGGWILYECTGTVVSIDRERGLVTVHVEETRLHSKEDFEVGDTVLFDVAAWRLEDQLDDVAVGDTIAIDFFRYKSERGGYVARNFTKVDVASHDTTP